jgi:hypothetical protein
MAISKKNTASNKVSFKARSSSYYSSSGFKARVRKIEKATKDIKQRSEVDSSKLHLRFAL